ncbi:MAG: aldehyde dehydrogenase family protein [Anaerolineales bacterium]|nr:aldehyde dehydrogenase family protein [Anaerolineales bacterium]
MAKKKTPKKKGGKKEEAFKLTYATMFSPPSALHEQYERALKEVKARMGDEHAMMIGGEDVKTRGKFEDRSPINQEWLLGTFQKGTPKYAEDAITAAREAYPSWSRTPWKKRVRYLRKVAKLIDERIYEIAAVISLEVGKNRMEALGDIAEAADLIRYACDQMKANRGYTIQMGKDPLKGFKPENFSVLRPYGVWVVISPFNFPAALTGGPVGAALVAGNTVVMKSASDTPWTVRLLAECFRDAGLPMGVCNFVTGPGSTIGKELITNAQVDGVTFTGSYDVGMSIYKRFAQSAYPRPIVLEMGGKNASIVSRKADLDRAAAGIIRSAFGLQGQKCSANSRIYVEEPVYQNLVQQLVTLTEKITIGDPTNRSVFFGPVINKDAFENFKSYTKELSQAGSILTGGNIITDGDLGKGLFCQPTLVADVPPDHRLWKHEMFLPITMVHPVQDLQEAMSLANESQYGLTAGFYGSEKEARWFFENIEVGVAYANRPQGSTTGAWPGFQPFGGWKGSGSSGKSAGGHYYLPLYMHEQSRTLIR